MCAPATRNNSDPLPCQEHHANWCKNLETLLLKGPDFLMRLLKIFKCQDPRFDRRIGMSARVDCLMVMPAVSGVSACVFHRCHPRG